MKPLHIMVLCSSLAVASAGCRSKSQLDVQQTATGCVADPAWLDSSEQPTHLLGDGTCGAYRLGWADFLYISGRAGDARRYEHWSDSGSLFPPDGQVPPPWGTQSHGAGCKSAALGALSLTDISNTEPEAAATKTDLAPDSILQAGSNDPLIDQNGRPIQYSIQSNETQYDYVAACELYKQQCYDTVGPAIRFPEQSIGLKVAWRVLETCDLPDSPKAGCKPDDPSRFLTARALVEPYSSAAGGCRQVLVGIVGMHIVHKVPTLPSMTWTTLEHVDNAPLCNGASVAPAGGWLFNDPECGDAYSCATNQYCDPCTKKCSTTGGYDPNCQEPLVPTQVCREKPILPEVEALNRSVHELMQPGDPRRNYIQVGTMYKPKGQETGPDVGSLYLANTTLETYFQVFAKQPGPPPDDSGCLGCHNNTYYSSDNNFEQADFSHMFRRIRSQGACSAELPAYCKAGGSSSAEANAVDGR